MIRLLITLLIVGVVSSTTCAQFKPNVANALKETNAGDLTQAKGEIDSAIQHYKRAVGYFEDKSETWFSLAKLYVRKKDYKAAVNAFSTAVIKGYFPCSGMIFDDFPNATSPAPLQPFVRSLDSLKGVFYTKHYDWELGDLLKELRGVDQFPRDLYDMLVPSDTMLFQRLVALADSTNLSRLLKYFDAHGFPKATTLDERAGIQLWLIIHHNLQLADSIADVAKLRKYTRDAVFNGAYFVDGYVRSLDYQHMGVNRTQLYGTYLKRNEKDEFSYYPIDDIKRVDKRRAQWYLPSLAEAALSNDAHPKPPADYDVSTQEQ